MRLIEGDFCISLRWRSPAAESGSAADAVGSQVQRLVGLSLARQAMDWPPTSSPLHRLDTGGALSDAHASDYGWMATGS
jgi:hypothetical protein